MDKIQIGIPCGHNCELYVNFLMGTIKKTVFNQSFFTGNAVDLYVGKNIFEITRNCLSFIKKQI